MFGKLKERIGGRWTILSVLGGIVLVGVFTLGVFVGNGKLSFKSQYASNTGLPSSLNYASVNQLYDAIRQNYNGKLTDTQLLDGLKHGLATSTGDPYTVYFTAKESQAFNNELQGTFTGIGAQLEQDTTGNIVVVSPIDGSPAAKVGIRAKDVIAKIDGKSTSGMTANDAVLKIRGAKGTKVTLTIVRDKTQQLSFTITRDDIQAPTATSKILDGNIGYLDISQFADNTDTLVSQAVTKFQQAGVKKIILDLRDNGGGEVDAATNISSNWLTADKVVLQEKRGNVTTKTINSTGDDPLKGIPTVVLVNAGTASASEITAAALHDNKAATIIGETSYGKGVEQELIDMPDGGQLKVTVASWYRPNGTNINKKGITPDQVVKMTEDDYKAGNDPQLTAAEAFLNK